jgi:hypothetical protein
MPRGALDATGICSHSSAHRRFQAWTAAGVFVTRWARGLGKYDALKGLEWRRLTMDGARPQKVPDTFSGPQRQAAGTCTSQSRATWSVNGRSTSSGTLARARQ